LVLTLERVDADRGYRVTFLHIHFDAVQDVCQCARRWDLFSCPPGVRCRM